MTISIIVAASANNVIGADGGLPWRLPEDLRHFKEITMGKPMIMGRKTWDSIGRALPGRRSIVVTRKAGFEAPGAEVVDSPEAALELAGNVDEMMIIGGGRIYEEFLPMTDRIYLTRVHAEIDGDTLFPELEESVWLEREREDLPQGDEREWPISFLVFERRSGSS